MRFVDTNILVYAAGLSLDDAGKRSRAREILAESGLVVSVQVLQEFYSQATRASRSDRLSPEDVLKFLEPILQMRVESLTPDVFRSGVSMSRQYKISYWDGAILAAARAAGCDKLYTEDLNHEQDYGGIQAINPFQR